jgi:periplasmic divalent cation tolerance protein
MKMNKFCQLFLTCANQSEAEKITRLLLNKHLAACVKQASVESKYLWEGEVEESEEVLLIMDSEESLFGQIEQEVANLHSYDTFVLQAIPVSKISKKAETWLNKSLNHG